MIVAMSINFVNNVLLRSLLLQPASLLRISIINRISVVTIVIVLLIFRLFSFSLIDCECATACSWALPVSTSGIKFSISLSILSLVALSKCNELLSFAFDLFLLL